MTNVGLPNERFLRKEFVVPTIFEIMDPYLTFLDMLPKVQADSRSVRYKQESTSMSGDTLKNTPVTLTAGAKFPRVDISNVTISSALLNMQGIEVAVDRDAVRFAEGVDQIARAYKRVAYWLAESINTNIGTTLTAGVTQGGGDWTPTAVWSAATATPVDDLIRFESLLSDQEGYPYTLSDVYIHKTNYQELKGYLTSIDIGDFKQQQIYGLPNITPNEITIPVVGAKVHKMLSGISEGGILGIDAKNMPATIFFNNDPGFSRKTVTYKGSDGQNKTINNFGFNFDSWVDPESKATIMQFWVDQVCTVMEPKSGLYDTGI
jgi:hypothetical protein